MLACVFKKPPCFESGNTFFCVSGLCPFGYDPFTDCFHFMSGNQKKLFLELKNLRAIVIRGKLQLGGESFE